MVKKIDLSQPPMVEQLRALYGNDAVDVTPTVRLCFAG